LPVLRNPVIGIAVAQICRNSFALAETPNHRLSIPAGHAFVHLQDTRKIMRKNGGRAERLAKRFAVIQEHNPAPPGPIGGQYKPLSDSDVLAIYQMALRILDELGMGQVPKALEDQCLAKGARLNMYGRLCFSAEFVQTTIDQAAKTVTLHGRDPKRSITVGGASVHFGTGGAAVQTLDLETGLYRASTLKDLYDFTRLQDTLANVSWFTRCCVATDLPDNFDLDLNTAYALLRGTTKPVATSFFLPEFFKPVVDMMEIAGSETGRFSDRPWLFAHISPAISPLRYGEDAFDVAMECMRLGLTINCITGAQAGATAPATLAGFLASSLAETLASLIMINIFEPGYPMIVSNWPFVVDLRNGSFSGAGGEVAVMNAASAQLINWLGLPSGVASSMSDAKAVDAQMGFEKGITATTAGLAGGNMIFESVGMMASLLGVSFEAFVLDDEMLSLIYRSLRGIEVTPESLGFEAIKTAVLGDGHFLGGQQTLDAMQRDYFYPSLSDRIDPKTWADMGATTMWDRARVRAKTILNDHHPTYIDPTADREIRKRFNILLK
jgi:trimethylamine--corrinoid protein Co-methyltransferase